MAISTLPTRLVKTLIVAADWNAYRNAKNEVKGKRNPHLGESCMNRMAMVGPMAKHKRNTVANGRVEDHIRAVGSESEVRDW